MGFPEPRTIGQRPQNAMAEGRIFVTRPDARSRKSLTFDRHYWRTGECRACQTLADARQVIGLEVTAVGEGIRKCYMWRAAC
jgi:hypothetical protein